MQFKNIIGQKNLITRLQSSVNENRISHAQLFMGNGTFGKFALAFAYAQFINCTNKQDKDSCGECSSCRKYAAMSHPDLFFSFPVNTNASSTSKISDTNVKKDPTSGDFLKDWQSYIGQTNGYPELFQWYQYIGIDNKQGLISKEEARRIIHQMQFKPAEAQYKVLIVWMVEKMHDYAANALLKLIEEPPDNTLIFMIANEKEKLLSTILSRVQTLVVPPIEKEDLFAFLKKQNPDMNRIELDDVINLSGGDIFKAKEIISDSDELQTNFNLFVDWMRLCYKTGSLEGIKNWVDNINKFGREKQKSFLYYSLRMVRESLLSNYGNEELVKLMHNEAEFLKKFAPFIHLKNAPEIQKNIELSIYEIERNAASAPLFTNLSLQMSILLKKPR